MNTAPRSILKVLAVVVIGAGMLLGGIALGRYGWGIAGYGPGMLGGGMMGGFGGFELNPLGAILSFVFWVFIIGGAALLVVWLVRNTGRSSGATSGGESPLDILKKRYARGEISKEQYDEMRRDLG